MRVLIVEDEVDLARGIERALREEGFVCDLAFDGDEGLYKAKAWEYDAILLDLLLPGCDGRTLLRKLRAEKPTPVLVLTAIDGTEDKVELLDSGADDYLVKPFELAELLARLKALIRRAAHAPNPILEWGEIQLDTAARTVKKGDQPIPLPPKEYALLEFLALRRGSVVSRTTIYEHLYSEDDETLSNVLDVYVANLRRKLGRPVIETRRGEGYQIGALPAKSEQSPE